MAEIKTVADIKGLGKVRVCYANFYDQLIALKSTGIKYPISIRDAAYMRLHEGPKDGTRTCHTPIWYKDAPLVLARISPLVENIEMAKQAVEANRNNKHFSTNDKRLYEKYVEMAVKDNRMSPGERRAIALPSNDNFIIDKNSEVSKFLFKDTIKYFNSFAQNGINFITPNRNYTQNKDGTGVSYLWFSSLDGGSDLYGYSRFLYSGSGAFWVSRSRGHAVDVAKNLPYSAKELQKLLKVVRNVISGKQGNLNLEKVVNFLERLKQ